MPIGARIWRVSGSGIHTRSRRVRTTSTQSSKSLTFPEIDAKWRRIWAKEPTERSPDTKPKSYILPMFPYPSGCLHMGHLRVYTISDVLARYKRMTGYDVLHPMGWDAFGLPAENAAIERGIDPARWTERNISAMKEQLRSMNAHFDWSHELSTCSPSFYKHTQKLFLMLHKCGLAYQAEAEVNYDPVDKTVLANEQVDRNGRSWRSGAIVQQLKLKQWFFRITTFKEDLLEHLAFLQKQGAWPENVLVQQRNWIGKSQGAIVRFRIEGSDPSNNEYSLNELVDIFTTRPDTLFGVTYLALSVQHPIVQHLASSDLRLKAFLEACKEFPADSKAGYLLPGIRGINPASHVDNRMPRGMDRESEVPVFVAPYVLNDYGTGAVMGVPGHDARDLAFWREQQPSNKVPIVVWPNSSEQEKLLVTPANKLREAFTGNGVLTPLCGSYAGLESHEAANQIVSDLKARDHFVDFVETWRLRDWLVSRQRYWGTPIPIVHCERCGPQPVPEEQLPVELPLIPENKLGQVGNALQSIETWVATTCPSCGGAARRDTDTMDTFVDSSWYFLRFPDAMNENQPFSKDSISPLLPVDTYVGGSEHAILHLLYARFMYKFLASEGLIPKSSTDNTTPFEPFRQLISQGMVHGKTYSDPATGRFFGPDELEITKKSNVTIKATGEEPKVTWEKMSKSKYNGVDPLDCIGRFGADATRAHILFAAPVGEVLDWDEEKIVGIQRWFQRISRLISAVAVLRRGQSFVFEDLKSAKGIFAKDDLSTLLKSVTDQEAEILVCVHEKIEAITRTFEHNVYGLNTTVSDLIKLTNAILVALPNPSANHTNPTEIERSSLPNAPGWAILHYSLSALIRMLAPIAPAFAEQCWEDLYAGCLADINSAPSVLKCPWPQSILDSDAIATLKGRRKTVTCAVQVNGKVRFEIQIAGLNDKIGHGEPDSHTQEAALLQQILDSEQGRRWFKEKHEWDKRKRTIIVKGGKLVNIVF